MSAPTDYEKELARLDADIADIEATPEPRQTPHAHDSGLDRAKRIAYKRYQRASLCGDYRTLDALGRSFDALIDPARPDPDLCYLKANAAFKVHRLDSVDEALRLSPALSDSVTGRALLADLDAQRGRYSQAQAAYQAMLDEEPSWDTLARLAHLEYKLGDIEAADRHFEEAEDELTAKEMRHYAWLELQRGLLDLSRGHHEEAGAHYDRAARAYSGHWMVAEHSAELLAARGACDAAAHVYEEVVARTSHPESMQALGELYAFMNRDDAARWFDAAEAAYLASVERGEVHYLHHLVDFHADVRRDGEQAVRFAERDLALRENHATLAAWAWALYRAGRFEDALAPMERALSFGVSDAHLFEQAAAVMRAAGRDGESLARRAREINPHVSGFHVHR